MAVKREKVARSRGFLSFTIDIKLKKDDLNKPAPGHKSSF